MNLNLSNTREARFLPGVVKYCYVFTIALVLLAFAGANAQAPDWQWAKGIGGIGLDAGSSIAVDASGNIYTTGHFMETVDFDPGVGVFNLTSAGYNYDIFISKYDNSGNFIWAKRAGGTSGDEGISLATDASGNIFITGYFQGPSITFGTTTLTNSGPINLPDIFIVKYDSSGNVLWAKRAGGSDYDEGYGVATDASGNVFVTGFFNSSTITFGTTTLTNAGGTDIFVVKYDASGNVIWAKSEGGNSYDYGNSVATDASGNIIIVGNFQSPTITFGTTILTKAGGTNSIDIYIAKYDSSGNVLWAKRAGGSSEDNSKSVATDASGNVFMTGNFKSPTIKFGALTLTNTSGGNYDIFIVKYNASGNVLWAKSAGDIAYENAYSVATDASGNLFITGHFHSPTITIGTTTFTDAGNGDILVVKYDASGNVLWAKQAGGSGEDRGKSVVTDASGNVFMTGFFRSTTIIFGLTTLTNNQQGNEDVFIAKLSEQSCSTFVCNFNPVLVTTRVSNFDCNDGSIKVIFNGTFQAFPHLELYDSTNSMISSVDLGVNAKKHTFSNLKPGSYTVKVFDNNCCEKVFVAYVKCAPPSSGFVTTNITTTSARLNWDIVNCAIGYRVQYRKLGDTTWTTTSINSNIGKKNLYLLQPNTTYEWHVATKCIGALSFPVYGPSVNQLFATAALKSGQLQDAYFTELFDIIIKPNPASKIITVNFETGNSTAVLKVINTMGQTVFENQLIDNDGIYEEQLDVSRFINGIYFLVVETENGVSRGKFVKE